MLDTLSVFEESLQFRVKRQALLSSNLANVDTPGYRRVDLRFDRALDRASSDLLRTHAQHRSGESGGRWRLERQSLTTRPDGNGVDFDQETVQLSRNAGAFGQTSEIMSRLIAMANTAITGE